MQSLEVNLASEQPQRHKELRNQVRLACRHAMVVSEDERELLSEAEEYGKYLMSKEVLTFEKPEQSNIVFVENTHEFLVLLKLALRQKLVANYGLTSRDLDTKHFQEFYKEWYEANIERHFEHEMKEHYLGALEYTSLKCYLGVEFFTKPSGLNFRPVIDFEGEVSSKLFREHVAQGSDTPSSYDKAITKQWKE